MALNQEQEKAIQSIMDWLKATNSLSFADLNKQWSFILQGYAGTGKTYLLAELINRLKIKFHCVAPTGKAASVLMSKLTGVEVITMHRLLYQPVDSDVFDLRVMMAKYKEEPSEDLLSKINLEKGRLAKIGPGFSSKGEATVSPGDLVIVDESSMVDMRLRDDLKLTGCRALFVGDPGQLPPVGSASWFIDSKPNAMLEEVQRQALDNPIIQMSLQIRTGFIRPVEWRKREGCGIWKKNEVDPVSWLDADQVITGSNASRHKVNKYFRNKLGYAAVSKLPLAGERLICLKNDYDRHPQFINGTQFQAVSNADLVDENGYLDIVYEGHKLTDVTFYPHHCLAHYDPNLSELPREFRKGLMELDFAYAITVHKSQGSEWDHVIIADDQMMKNDARFRKRWLYTAVTRAKKTVKIIQ